MSVTRYTDGTTTITLGGAMEAYVRRLAEATQGAALTVLEREAHAVEAKAEAEWYGPNGVTKRTGKSGTIDTVTTVAPNVISVAVGSRDLGKAKYVHRPGPLSEIQVPASPREWWDSLSLDARDRLNAKKRGGAYRRRTGAKLTKPAANPKASDGKYLLQELVAKPARQIVKKVNAVLPTEINAEMRGSRR